VASHKINALTLTLAASAAAFCSPSIGGEPRGLSSGAGTTVKVVDDRFMRDGRELVITGVNYFPAYNPAISPPASWIDAKDYRPEIVENELAAIERLGFNLVSIRGPQPDPRPNEQDCVALRDFLARAQRHNLLVQLFIGTGAIVPITPPEQIGVVPAVCKLAGNSAIFAYDIAWEPHFGVAVRRNELLQSWLTWLTVSYGSTPNADKSFGGTHVMPSDAELCADTPTVRVSAYKRFLDDALSRNYRDVRAALMRVDSTHLIGARSGYGGNGSKGACGLALVDLRAGAKHLDFISPEGYALDTADRARLLSRGGFTTAYADVGKPVFWAEFGLSADGSCPDCSEQGQANYLSNMWALMKQTQANGGALWWFVGVRPQHTSDSEKSDFGIVYDYMKYPTVVDGAGKHARTGTLAFCTMDADRQSLVRSQGSHEPNGCAQGFSGRGRFRSEAPLDGSDFARDGKTASRWEELCSRDDNELLITTTDQGTGQTYECPRGYEAAGSFKPAASTDHNPIVSTDANGRSIKDGWVTLCTLNGVANLTLVYDGLSGARASCPSGTVSAGTVTPQSAPIYRAAARQIAGTLAGTTAAKRRYSSWITVDRQEFAGDWKMYEEGIRSYATAASGGQLVGVRTACFGATSKLEKSCVGNVPFNKACPAKCLNAEWNTVEILNSDSQWLQVGDGATATVQAGMPIHVRLSAGNVGESAWSTTSTAGGTNGSVRFGCNENAGDFGCRSEIRTVVPGGGDASSGDIVISGPITKTTRVAFQMVSEGVAWFGERRSVTLTPK
jgi:hypothetical protein